MLFEHVSILTNPSIICLTFQYPAVSVIHIYRAILLSQTEMGGNNKGWVKSMKSVCLCVCEKKRDRESKRVKGIGVRWKCFSQEKNLQEALRATSAVIRRRESVMVSSLPIPEPWAPIPKKKEIV